jgi:hypothetical protein
MSSIGPGPIQRDQRDDVLESRRRRLFQKLAHAARFELEHGGGVAGLHDVVGGVVVERQCVQRQRVRGIEAADVAQRPVEDGQRGEAEKVELDEAHRLDVVLVELRHDRVRARLGVERTEVGQLARRDQHAAGVHADIAGQSLERFGEGQKLAHFLLVLFALGQQAVPSAAPAST